MPASNLMPHPKHYFALILNLRPQNLQSVSKFEQFVSKFEQTVSKFEQSVLNWKFCPQIGNLPPECGSIELNLPNIFPSVLPKSSSIEIADKM